MVDVSDFSGGQRRAVEWQDGPLLVRGGPGAGKTRVLVYRIARLILDKPRDNFRVLALSATGQAVAEMKKRFMESAPDYDRLYSLYDQRVEFETFHSFLAGLLRSYGHHIGLAWRKLTMLTRDTDRHGLLDEAMKRAGAFQPSEKMLPLVAWLTERDIAPGDALPALREASVENPEAPAAVYQQYRALMMERQCLDSCGAMAEGLAVLDSRSGFVGKHMRVVYPYICVDEFQDVSFLQYQALCRLVSPDTKNIFMTTDGRPLPAWNGAYPARRDAPPGPFDAELLQLPENHECPPKVVGLAHRLVVRNPGGVAEKGVPEAGRKEPAPVVHCQGFDDFAGEADWVAQHIAARDRAAQARCVVLARTRRLIEQVPAALGAHGLDGCLAPHREPFDSAPLRWLHAVLRLAHSRNRREYLRRVCDAFSMIEGVRVDVEDVATHAAVGDGDCLRSWTEAALRQNLSKRSRDLLEQSLAPKLVDRLEALGFEEDAAQWLDALPGAAPNDADRLAAYEEEKEIWKQLMSEIIAQHDRREITLRLLLRELDLRFSSPEPPPGAVPCLTIDEARGMAFDHVYLVGMVEEQLPHWDAIQQGDDSREMEEERRSCFAAVTRTQETLTLTYSGNVLGRPRRPSRFLYEMGLLED